MDKRRVGRVRKRDRNAARKRNISLEELELHPEMSDASEEDEPDLGYQEHPEVAQPEQFHQHDSENGDPMPADDLCNSTKDPWDKKLHPGARLTVGQFLALFCKIAEASKLPNSAKNNLLYVQSLMFAENQDFPSSLYLLKSGLEKRSLTRTVESHLVCLSCGTYGGAATGNAGVCMNEHCREKLNAEESSFIYLPLAPVLKAELTRTTMESICPHPSKGGALDFTAGAVYRNYYNSGVRFVPLAVFSDGASAAKSSSASVWVLQYHIPSRPEKPKPTLSTIWFRSSRLSKLKWKEPEKFKQSLLRPFVTEVVQLQTHQIHYEQDGAAKSASLRVLYWIADSQERWRLLNQTCFTGPFGCVHCETPGKRIPLTSENNRTLQCYPLPNKAHLLENLGDLRDIERVRGLAAEAAIAREERDPQLLKGVRGTTILSELLHFDSVLQVPPEPMHLCFEGVEKMVIDFRKAGPIWKLSPEQRRSVDDYLIALQPPTELTRLRPLSQTGQWKAHEYLGFTLYHALPCLYGLLNEKDFLAYAKFATACQLLFMSALSEADLFNVSKAFLEFSMELQLSAGERFMSYNLHQLWCHLVVYVHHLGHPAAFWAFEHESYFGNLKRHPKGSKNPAKELAEKTTLAEASEQLILTYVKDCPDEAARMAYTTVSNGLHIYKNTVLSPTGTSYFFGASELLETIREKDNDLYCAFKSAFPGAPVSCIRLYNRCLTATGVRLDSVDYRRKRLHVDAAFVSKAGGCFLAKKFAVGELQGRTTGYVAAYRTTEPEWHRFGFQNDPLLKLDLFQRVYRSVGFTKEIKLLEMDDIARKILILPDRHGNNLAVALLRNNPD